MTKIPFITLIITALSLITGPAAAQLRFEVAEHDFGQIPEEGGPVSCSFTGVNEGSEPLVILDVTTSCGCTVPVFSRQPVMPGASTRIVVKFDPQGRPGNFDRTLAVYSTLRRKEASLAIRGYVTPRPRSTEELYPVDAGQGLRLNSTLCAFTYIYPDSAKRMTIGYVNTAPHPVRLELKHRTASGLLEVRAPQTIGAGESGEMEFSYLIPSAAPRYGTLKDALELFVDGRSRGTTLVTHAIGVDNPLLGPKEKAAKAVISENMIKFGAVKRRGGPRRAEFTLTNGGRSELAVRAVECGDGLSASLAPGMRIAPGASLRVVVTLDPAEAEYGFLNSQLMLVTNDPVRPMRRLRVSGTVEE